MPAPTDFLSTPTDPIDPNLAHMDVEALVAEVTGDLVKTAKAMATAQAEYEAAYDAYHAVTVGTDDTYNALLSQQEAARTALFTSNFALVADSHEKMQAKDGAKKAAEAAFAEEIKYVVGLAGGDAAASDPTPAPSTTTSTTQTSSTTLG